MKLNPEATIATEKGLERFTETTVTKLLERILGEDEEIVVEKPEHGYSQCIFRFRHHNQIKYIRLRTVEEVHIQDSVQRLAAGRGVPVATVERFGYDHVLDTGYLIQNEIEGRELYNFKDDERIPTELLKAAGKTMSQMHKVTLPGFGKITTENGKLRGKYDTWADFISARKPDPVHLRNHDLVSETDLEILAQKIAKTSEAPIFQSVLLHNDLHTGHIFTDGTEITGIIDWDRALVGDPHWDLAVTFSYLNETEINDFKEGYGVNINDQTINNYLWMITLQKIMRRHQNRPEALDDMLERLEALRSKFDIN